MRNKIRHYRRKLGLTQSELAKKLGTSTATVSRLETEGIKISVDWLQPLSTILHVPMVDLLDEPATDLVPLLGAIDRTGKVSPVPGSFENGISISVPARNPVAARLERSIGPFNEGEVLIGNKLHADHLSQGLDRTCFVGVKSGLVLLAHLLPSSLKGTGYALVPLHSGGNTRYVSKIDWCAPIVMAVRYL